jgi:hypothetical protein
MNLMRGINGRILRLEEGQRFNPGLPPETIPDPEDKNETKTATPTSSLMTFRSMNL